jgi:hypothetical protein
MTEDKELDIRSAVAVSKSLAIILDEMRKDYGGIETYVGLQAFMTTFHEESADNLPPDMIRHLDRVGGELGRAIIKQYKGKKQ